jgi:two-component system CheB/CheR fusion protein
MHHGTLTARSTGPNQGSVFEMRLPLDLTATGETADAAAPPPSRLHRVLIVEDNRDARAALRVVLEMEGHTVVETGDGATAVRLAVEATPDVIVLDIGLPDTDGFEAARRIRLRLGPQPRLIALSGYGDDETKRQARECGFDAYLVKPVSPDQPSAVLDAV